MNTHAHFSPRGKAIVFSRMVLTAGAVLIFLMIGALGPDRSASASDDDRVLEEVIVTAQKREQSLQDVPIAISAFSGEQLRSGGFEKLETLSDTVPNFFVSESFVGDAIYVRGIGSAQNNLGTEQAVGLVLDGVFYGRSRFSRMAFLDLERVEVLKGPQGALIGKNTTAGAINVTTAKPTDSFEAYITPSYEILADEGYSIEGAISGPVTEALKARVAFRYDDRDGFIKNTSSGEDHVSVEDAYVRAQLLWEPTGEFDVTLTYQYGDLDHDGENNQISLCDLTTPQQPTPGGLINLTSILIAGTTEDCTLDYRRSGLAPRGGQGDFAGKTTNFDSVSIVANWQVADHAITSITGWAQYDYQDIQDSDRTIAESIAVDFQEDFEQWSQEFRLISPQGNILDYLVGAYFQRKEQHTQHNIDIAAFNARRNTITDEDDTTYAIFAQVTWNINDQWAATLSGRFTHEEKDARQLGFPSLLYDSLTPISVPPFAPVGLPLIHDIEDELSENDFSPTFSLQWRPNDDVMLYANVGRGFKAGAFDHAMVGNQTDAEANFQTDNEDVTSVELGAKLTLLNGTAQLNAAVFNSEFSNLQQAILIGEQIISKTVNAADATTRGAEADFRWRPIQNLTLFASAAYLDSEFDKFPNAICYALQNPVECVNGRQDLAGQTLTFAPAWAVTVNAEYVWHLARGYQLVGFLQGYYSDEFFLTQDLDPKLLQDDYFKYDGRLTLMHPQDRWEFSLIARNIGNTITSHIGDDVPVQTGTVWRAVDPPRSLTIQGTWRF